MSNSLVSAIVAALQSVLAALVLLEVVQLTTDQLAGIVTAVSSLLAIVVVWRGAPATGDVKPENSLQSS